MAQHNELGRLGEVKAQEFLRTNGYHLLDCNWRYEKCELDIVCSFQNLIVVVEVKTRSGNYFGNPAEFVGPAQQKKLIDGAEAYLEVNNLDCEIRFDIIEVLFQNGTYSIQHLENAFSDGM